jgi:integrase
VRQSILDNGCGKPDTPRRADRTGCNRHNTNKLANRVRHLFKWAVAEELLHPSVYQALAAVPGLKRGRCEAREGQPVKPVPQEHIEAIQDHVSKQVWALVQLQLLTGARAGELVTMRSVDIDTTGKIWTYEP